MPVIVYSPSRWGWCKGKVGTPHEFEWVRWLDLGVHTYSDGRSITWYIEKCRACGRHGRFQTVQRITVNEGNKFSHIMPDGRVCTLERPQPAVLLNANVCPCREYEVHWKVRTTEGVSANKEAVRLPELGSR